MDETGQPDGPPPGANGNGQGERESRLRGWAHALAGSAAPEDGSGSARGTAASWSNAGSALEPPAEPVAPQWLGPDAITPYGHRYADLLNPLSPPLLSPNGGGRPAEPAEPVELPADYEPWSPAPAPPAGPTPQQYAVPPLPPQHVPTIEPTPPGGLPAYRRPANGYNFTEHPAPVVEPPSYAESPAYAEPSAYAEASPYAEPLSADHVLLAPPARSSGPAAPEVSPAFPEPPRAPSFTAPPADGSGGPDEPTVRSGPEEPPHRAAGLLPQRVPAEPDVPTLPEPVTEEADERAEVPELARIATYLRHEELASRPLRESLDVDAVLAAVRGVYGVRDAELRTNPGGVHSLRLDLADGADPGPVSREVARLLKDRLGLAAALGSPTATPMVAPTDRGPVRVGDGVYQGRRRGTGTARGRATVEPRPEDSTRALSGEQPASRPLPRNSPESLRIVLDHVQVSTFGLDATVEVRLASGQRRAIGEAHGPAVDGYVLRMAAIAAASALDRLLVTESTGASKGRCFVEHASLVPFGTCEVAVVVILLVCGGWVEQLAGSALVAGDPKQAMVRATLSAVNRRMESLLP